MHLVEIEPSAERAPTRTRRQSRTARRSSRRDSNHETTAHLRRAIEAAMGQRFERGNDIRVLRNGDEIFTAMLEALEQARESIDLLTYVYWQGSIARRFAEVLSHRAKQGVRVRVLLDGVGSQPMDETLLAMMESSGVQVGVFRPPVSWKVWRANHRTHRKVLICDGRVAFTGGVGIAEEWTGDARSPDEWRDTHLTVRGPAVLGLQAAFTGNWLEAVRDATPVLPPSLQAAPCGDALAMTVRSTASVGWSDVATLLWTIMSHAEHRIRIATAYFVPDQRTVELLCDRARKGLSIEILVPGPHHDQRVCDLAGWHHVGPLLEAGVAVYRFQPTMMHAKIMLVDEDVALVGSPNLNHRSLRQDDECAALIIDRSVCETLDRHFDDDLARSRQVTIDDWDHRSWFRRMQEWLARAFRSSL